MKKGINLDVNPRDHAEDVYPYALNVVRTESYRAFVNERGDEFRLELEGKKVLGTMSLEKHFLLFLGSAPNVFGEMANSEIAVYDTDAQELRYVQNLNYQLRFHNDYPIQSVYQRNNKGEIVIAFTDDLNPPRIININTVIDPRVIEAPDENDTLLFPDTVVPNMSFRVRNTGGNLYAGTYWFGIKYRNDDGTVTGTVDVKGPAWTMLSNIQADRSNFAGNDGSTLTNKSIEIQFEGLDTRFQYIDLVIIAKINGVYRAWLIERILIDTINMQYVYSGTEDTNEIPLEEALVPMAWYNKAYTIALHENRLYIGNLEGDAEENYQPIANNVVINYNTRLVHLDAQGGYGNNQIRAKGFAHGEVYAFYIRFNMHSGMKTRWYHIPGREALASDIAAANFTGLNLSQPYQKYQVDDTCDTAGATSNMGYWENKNEQYPTEGNFPTGNVRHHRFPSIEYCKRVHYLNEPLYGVQYLDKLSIDVENVDVLQNPEIQSWEIGYAKRSYTNSTVIDTDICLLGALKDPSENQNGTTFPDRITTTAGNWNLSSNRPGASLDWQDKLVFAGSTDTREHVRMHSPSILLRQPSIFPYLKFELRMQKANLAEPYYSQDIPDEVAAFNSSNAGIGRRGGRLARTGNNQGNLAAVVIDYTADNVVANLSTINDTTRFRSLDRFEYIPANTLLDDWNNITGEACAVGVCHNKIEGLSLDGVTLATYSANDNGPLWRNNKPYESTYLTSIMQFKEDMYNRFDSQTVIPLDTNFSQQSTANNTEIWGGDTFSGYYSFTTHTGRHAQEEFTAQEGTGVFIIRRHVTESTINTDLIHEGSEVWERKYPLTEPIEIVRNFALSQAHNSFRYNEDYSALNDLNPGDIFDPTDDLIDDFPYRVAWSEQMLTEATTTGWKTWRPNNYWEQPKNKGEITNLASLADKFIVHHQFSVFLTRTRLNIQTDNISGIYLGAVGSIFEAPPQEILPNSGFAGTHHKLGAIVTKLGYIFADVTQGRLFILTDTLQEISSKGLRHFFQEYLRHRKTEVQYKKIRIPFKSFCMTYDDGEGNIEKRHVFVIHKHRDNADMAPESTVPGTIYTVEYDFYKGSPRLTEDIQLRGMPGLDTEGSVLVKRSHYWLYTLKLWDDYPQPMEGYIYMDSYVKHHVQDMYENPYNNIGITIGFDEQTDRILITKNNKGNQTSTGQVRGNIKTQPSLLCFFEDGDLVEYWSNTDPNDAVEDEHKVYRLRLQGDCTSPMKIYRAENGVDND